MFFQNSERKKLDKCHQIISKNVKQPGSLDVYSDPEMEQFFTKGIRGGQSFICQRYAKGNDDPKKKGYHLLYIDGKLTLSSFYSL